MLSNRIYDVLSHACLLLAETPADGKFSVDVAWAALIIFLILVGVLWKFAWGPIVDGLKKREDGIEGEIAAAQASNQEARRLLEEYQHQLARAGDEVRAMIDNATRDAQAMKQGILDEAQRAATAERERAAREIEAAKNAAISEIAQHSVNIAFRLAGDAVRMEIKPDDHRGLIEDALKQFESKN